MHEHPSLTYEQQTTVSYLPVRFEQKTDRSELHLSQNERKMVRMDTDALTAAIDTAVGAELRGLRAKRGVTRAQLSKKVNLGISTIQRIENGERSPELRQLARILQALDMPMNEFVTLALKNVDGVK